MGSNQAAGGSMGQLHDSLDSSWTTTAYEAVQDIAAALQSGRDDIQPLDDAPSYQVLCGTARAACSQAEASIQSSIQQTAILHPKQLDCLGQLSTATLQLSAAVCCDPAVALPLISSGAHAAALDQLKGAVKSLTQLWAACMDCLQQQGQHAEQHQGFEQSAGQCTATQHAWQCVTPALASTVKLLLHMSVTSAEFVSSGGSSQQVPKEMCSMSALNLSWANLTRLLVTIPVDVRMQVLEVQDFMRGLQCALQQLHSAVMDLPVQPRERQEVLVRFWLQSVSRLTSAVWEDASSEALQPFLGVTLEVYSAVMQQRQEFAAVQDILQYLLQPRLLACVASLFANSSNPATFQAKLDLLMQHPGAFGQQDSPSQHQHNQHLKAQVHLALDALQKAMPSMPLDHIAPACKQIVRWALSTTGQELMVALLAPAEASAAAAAVDGSAHGQDESAWDAAGLELQQSVLQGCLVALLVCWTLLQDMQQQQLELLAAVNTLAVSAHPLVSFLAQQLLADLIAAAGSSELAAQQLALLHKLLGASAAAAAVPGASCDVDRVVDRLAAVLQACDPAFAGDWLRHHIMLGHGSSSDTPGSSTPWLHAGACSLLVQESALLQRLVRAAPQLMPVSQPQLQEVWTQLWSTAAQLAELLDPSSLKQLQLAATGSTAGSSSDRTSSDRLSQQQAETLLVLHQLSWLFSAMRAALQLLSELDPAAASSLKQEATELALDVLRAASAGLGEAMAAGSPNPASVVTGVQFACTAAVLRLLSQWGQLTLQEEQARAVLGILRGLAEQQPGLHGVLAGVLGGLGAEATSGNREYVELFQLLLASPHWATQHAAFDSLHQLLRHTNLKNNLVSLLPAGMKSSPTEAKPEAISIVRAYVAKKTDSQAQASFTQHYPRLAAEHKQCLSAHAAAQGSTSLLGLGCMDPNVQELQRLLAACDLSAGSGGLRSGLQQQQQQHEGMQGSVGSGQGSKGAVGAAGGAHTQALLAQAAAAAKKLETAQQALNEAESDVQLLLSAVFAAARDQSLGADGILLISREGSNLMGNVASMISRLRGMQDGLTSLRR